MYKFITLTFLFVGLFASPANLSISVKGNHFIDEYGRVRIFHGASRIEKGFPWYFEEMYLKNDSLDIMQESGLNVVRLGWMWTGYEPNDS